MTSCLIYLDGKNHGFQLLTADFPLSIHRLLSFLAAGHAQLQRLRSSCSGLNIPWNSSLDGIQRSLAYMTSCQLIYLLLYVYIYICKSLTINMGIYQGGITNHPFRGFKPHFPSGVQRGLAYMTSCLIYLDGKKPWVSTFNRGFSPFHPSTPIILGCRPRAAAAPAQFMFGPQYSLKLITWWGSKGLSLHDNVSTYVCSQVCRYCSKPVSGRCYFGYGIFRFHNTCVTNGPNSSVHLVLQGPQQWATSQQRSTNRPMSQREKCKGSSWPTWLK